MNKSQAAGFYLFNATSGGLLGRLTGYGMVLGDDDEGTPSRGGSILVMGDKPGVPAFVVDSTSKFNVGLNPLGTLDDAPDLLVKAGNYTGGSIFLFDKNGASTCTLNASDGSVSCGAAAFNSMSSSGNVTAQWFQGSFNWVVGNDSQPYLVFTGTQLDVNESKLNETIDSRRVNDTKWVVSAYGIYANATNVGIGTTTNPTYPLDIVTTSSATRQTMLEMYSNTSLTMGGHIINRYRGSPESPVLVQDGDSLGVFGFGSYDGIAGYAPLAGMWAYHDAVTGTIDMPTRLEFRTTPDGSTSSATRLIIKENGRVGIGVITPTTTLDVNGSVNLSYATSILYTPQVCLANTCRTSWPVDTTCNATGICAAGNVAYMGYNNGAKNFTVDTTTFHVDSTNDDVGIGTASPINAGPGLELSGSNPALQFTDTDGSSGTDYHLAKYGDNFTLWRGTYGSGTAMQTWKSDGESYLWDRLSVNGDTISSNIVGFQVNSNGSNNANIAIKGDGVDDNMALYFLTGSGGAGQKGVVGWDSTTDHIVLAEFLNGGTGLRINRPNGYVRFGDTTTASYRIELPNTASASGQGRANNWVTYSSEQYKKDIVHLNTTSLKQVYRDLDTLNVSTFTYKDNPTYAKYDLLLDDNQQQLKEEYLAQGITKDSEGYAVRPDGNRVVLDPGQSDNITRYGFILEETPQHLIAYDGNGQPGGIGLAWVAGYSFAQLKAQKQEIDELKQKNMELEEKINVLEQKINQALQR